MEKGEIMATTLEFKQHPNHLRNTVLRQAGTLWKAILEGVMNSVDAGATHCHITLDKDMVTITDDGRGFQSRDEISDFFQTFGTPHEDNDATYGEFRMGRGQIMAFGVNTWHTNNYVMDVDIRDKGMNFELEEVKEVINGCSIVMHLYDKLIISQLAEAERELEKFVKYVDIPVYLNDKRISQDPADNKWDYVTDEAYIKLTSTGSLNVYNLGVYVTDIGSHNYGVGGEVVSRKRLKLNFARNDVMRRGHEKCPEWAKIEPNLKSKATETNLKTNRLNDTGRTSLVRSMLHNEAEEENYSELLGKKVFTDVRGRHWSINGLRNKFWNIKQFSVAPKGSKVGERIHEMGKVFVFSTKTAQDLGCYGESTYQIIASDLDRCYKHVNGTYRRDHDVFDIKYVALNDLKDDFDESFEFLTDKQLTERQRVLLAVLNNCQTSINGLQDRTIVLGESDVATAWTDGGTYVALDVKFIKEIMERHNFDVKMFTNLGLLLTHEFCHDALDRDTHSHDIEFMDRYEQLLEGSNGFQGAYLSYAGLGQFVHDCTQCLPEYLRRANRRLTQRQARCLGNMEKGILSYEKLVANEEITAAAEAALAGIKAQFKAAKKIIKSQ
jgi:hypothetical protein